MGETVSTEKSFKDTLHEDADSYHTKKISSTKRIITGKLESYMKQERLRIRVLAKNGQYGTVLYHENDSDECKKLHEVLRGGPFDIKGFHFRVTDSSFWKGGGCDVNIYW